jgi:hypothetical protein
MPLTATFSASMLDADQDYSYMNFMQVTLIDSARPVSQHFRELLLNSSTS